MNRKTKDMILDGLTYISSGISVFVLIAIVLYLIIQGASSINWHLLSSNYNVTAYNAAVVETNPGNYAPYNGEGVYSEQYGVAFKDITTAHNDDEIQVVYIDSSSPLANMQSLIAGEEEKTVGLSQDSVVQSLYYYDQTNEKVFLSRTQMKDATTLVDILDNQSTGIYSINYQTLGGGIRGSIIVTLYLIVISLLISLPIGIASAIYLHEYATKSKINSLIRSGIDTLTGVPSIVYGLMGVTVLFPVTQLMGATSTSILLGGLTLAIILLPTIIRSTEEALMVVPQSLRDGSLSLGATKSQTIFKVVLPCAVNGILTGILLGIGRVIGESAALVYTTSTVINDYPTLLGQGTSLSLMIWSIMSGEQPNYELASAISLIILILVFIINILVKVVAKRFSRRLV